MKKLSIKLELLSPLSIPAESRSNFPVCNDFISGSLLRGAMAGQYLREQEHDQFFQEVFVDKAIFGNMYPANYDYETKFFPASTVSCKRYGLEHGIKDNLLIFSAQELNFRKNSSLKNLEKAYRCSHKSCTHDLKPQNGFYYMKDNKAEFVKLNKQVHIHTGINRDTGNVQEGIFYGLEEITPYFDNGQASIYFQGEICIDDKHAEKFKSFWENQVFFMGSNKTRGNGRVMVKSIETVSKEKTSLENRLNNFNQEYQKYLKEQFQLELSEQFFFALDFTSDAILLDKFLRYTYISQEMEKLDLVFQSVSSTMVKGWNSLWQLPKETESAVKKGSCYLFSIPKKDLDLFKEQFEVWEENGLGLRKSEGFGKVSISNAFHIDNAVRGIN